MNDQLVAIITKTLQALPDKHVNQVLLAVQNEIEYRYEKSICQCCGQKLEEYQDARNV